MVFLKRAGTWAVSLHIKDNDDTSADTVDAAEVLGMLCLDCILCGLEGIDVIKGCRNEFGRMLGR